MHPFGGTAICPRCDKSVYAAEQVMGPGRRLYHKPCLACNTCNKRLDSYTLLEHDQKPYCKPCHVKNFGTRDLRQANLPHREESSPPISPTTSEGFSPSSPMSPHRRMSPTQVQFHGTGDTTPTYGSRSPPPVRHATGGSVAPTWSRRTNVSPPPILKPNRTLSSNLTQPSLSSEETVKLEANIDRAPSKPRFIAPLANQPPPTSFSAEKITNIGRGFVGLPRTTPLSPMRSEIEQTQANTIPTPPRSPTMFDSATVGRTDLNTHKNSYSLDSIRSTVPLVPTSTGTRYGIALSGGTPPPVRKFGGGTPSCPKCGKSVYFAEQVRALGKTWHKACLRCTECSTVLDQSRLTENEGDPLCHRCYGKLHGPRGGGYALLGKAGG